MLERRSNLLVELIELVAISGKENNSFIGVGFWNISLRSTSCVSIICLYQFTVAHMPFSIHSTKCAMKAFSLHIPRRPNVI